MQDAQARRSRSRWTLSDQVPKMMLVKAVEECKHCSSFSGEEVASGGRFPGGLRRTNSGLTPEWISALRRFAAPPGKVLAEGSSVNTFATKLAQRCRSISLPFATFRSFF